MSDPEKNNSQASGGATAGSGGDSGPRGGGVGGGAVASISWGATASGPSISTTSGGSTGSQSSLGRVSHGDDVGVGSPSSLAVAMTPARDSTFLRMNHLDIPGDDARSLGDVGCQKKKRGQRATAGDKSGRGLRQLSMKVCEKVESKGRTTYNEVADELVAEFADPGNSAASPDHQQYDEKNIRRRVYDALNVLMAMDIISKDKKEITWKGLPRTSLSDIEELKKERQGLRSRIEKKSAYLQELEEQYIGLRNLIQRNEQLFNSGNGPTGGIALPFLLVQFFSIHHNLKLFDAYKKFGRTTPLATVEVEISEDMQLVHFDFDSTSFELHDDSYVLKAMKLCERPESNAINPEFPSSGGEGSSMYQPHITPSVTTPSGRPSSPPIPGIFKAQVKYEH